MSDTRATSQSVRYRERLWVPWWWWPPGLGLAGLIALEVNQGVPAVPNWVPFAVLLPVAAVALLWFGKTEVRVVSADARSKEGSGAGEIELWVGAAHLPVSVIARIGRGAQDRPSRPRWAASSIRPPTSCTGPG